MIDLILLTFIRILTNDSRLRHVLLAHFTNLQLETLFVGKDVTVCDLQKKVSNMNKQLNC